MEKVSVIARLVAQPGRRDDLTRALAPLLDNAAGEPGTLVYTLHEDGTEPDVLWIYELYAGQEALDAHRRAPAMADAGPALMPLLAGPPELHFCVPVGGKGL